MSNPNTAEEIAKKYLDSWNDTTGFVGPNTGYYFELLSVMEDAMQQYADDRIIEVLKEEVELLQENPEADAPGFLSPLYHNDQIAIKMQTIIQYFEAKKITDKQ